MNSKDLARDIVLAAAMIGVLPLAGFCALAKPAAGADFGQPFPGFAAPAPLAERVEFASNWYVRGDIAYAQETFPNISPFTFGSSPSVFNTFSADIGGDTRSTIIFGRISFSIIARRSMRSAVAQRPASPM